MSCKQEVKFLNLTLDATDINNAVKSFIFSKKYTKTMVRVSLLNLLYHRINMDDNDFIKKSYDDVPFVVYKKKVKNTTIREYHCWVTGIVDAIENNYLKEIHLFMKQLDNNDIVEYYKFSLQYNDAEDVEVKKKSDDLRNETKYLLKVINDLGTKPKLTENVIPTIELTYWDETPENYEPPGFMRSIQRNCFNVSKNVTNDLVVLGKLNTGFHRIACRARERIFESLDEQDNIKSRDVVLSENSSDKKAFSAESVMVKIMVTSDQSGETAEEQTKNERSSKLLNSSNITVSDTVTGNYEATISDGDSVLIEEIDVNCLCKLTFTSLNVDLICCTKCKIYYHLPCQGYLRKSNVIEPFFVCFPCDPSSDELLQRINKDDWSILARLRLFLSLIDKEGRLPSVIHLLPVKEKNLIFNQLRSHQIYVSVGDKWNINRTMLSKNITSFFKNIDSQVLS